MDTLLNRITVVRGSELVGEALRHIPRKRRYREGNSVIFFDREDMEKFYKRLRFLRGDMFDNRKMKGYSFGRYK